MPTLQIETEAPLLTEFTPPEALRFYRNPQGFLALRLGGEDYTRVQLRRALPFAAPEQYICVTDMEDKELAVIEGLDGLNDENRALVQAELDLRYYYPIVKEINNIKEKMGTYYFTLTISGQEKSVAVKDITKNLRQLEGGTIVLTDVDGNRFLIPNVYAIKRKSLRMLEPYLY